MLFTWDSRGGNQKTRHLRFFAFFGEAHDARARSFVVSRAVPRELASFLFVTMKRTREESTYGGEPAHHPDVQQIEIDNVQELQRWVVRNWEENTTNILAIERLWKDCKPLKLLKKELDCTGSGTHPIWKEMEIVSLPQLETDSAKKRSFCVVVRDVTKMRNELVRSLHIYLELW